MDSIRFKLGLIGAWWMDSIRLNLSLSLSHYHTLLKSRFFFFLIFFIKVITCTMDDQQVKYQDISSDTYNPVPGVMDGVPASRNYDGGFSSKLMSLKVEFTSSPGLNGVIHIFEEHVVLQFNHKIANAVRVDVDVSPAEVFTKLDIPPIKDVEGVTFVAFKQNAIVSKATFSSTLINEQGNNRTSLDVLVLSAKDYLKGVGSSDFYLKRGRLPPPKHIYKYLNYTLYKGYTLETAVTSLRALFGI